LDNLVKIIVADDDDLCRGLIKDSIEMNNVEIFLASDGLEALKIIKDNNADVLITDLNMPNMDGLSLINHARQLNPNIVSIIITGFGSLESAIKAIQQGAYDYVQKPFSVERITVVARNAVEKTRTLKEKSKLLRELETAYQNLKCLENKSRTMDDSDPAKLRGPSQKDGYYLLSQPSLPLFCYDSPTQSSTQMLNQLERLKELKREGVIADGEFAALKQLIIRQLRPVAS
jgi:YesN/AraC family two-component response regulator